MKPIYLILLLVTTLFGFNALIHSEEFNPKDWKKQIHGPLTQVMVLGSPHLNGFGKNFKVEMLTILLDKLAKFEPEIITIEALSGQQREYIRQYPTEFPGVFDNYCWDNQLAQKITGLTVSQAIAKANEITKQWQHAANSQPSPQQRRHLAAVFLAANDRFSAQVQWLKLTPEERHTDKNINHELLSILNRKHTRHNENYDIGVALAVRLGLERVYSIDDHTADNIQTFAGEGFESAIREIWSKIDTETLKEKQRVKDNLANADDLLALYRQSNDLKFIKPELEYDFGQALTHQSAQLFGRQYVAWWETRNLRMVANIRTAFANKPGAKVLSIVGSSHKPYFDAYLNMMHEVTLVETNKVLQ